MVRHMDSCNVPTILWYPITSPSKREYSRLAYGRYVGCKKYPLRYLLIAGKAAHERPLYHAANVCKYLVGHKNVPFRNNQLLCDFLSFCAPLYRLTSGAQIVTTSYIRRICREQAVLRPTIHSGSLFAFPDGAIFVARFPARGASCATRHAFGTPRTPRAPRACWPRAHRARVWACPRRRCTPR